VAKYPDSTKTSLTQRLAARARERWPDLAGLAVRHHGVFSYVDGVLADGTTMRLCRLRYTGSAHSWRFAIYRASHEDYDDSFFPTGLPTGTGPLVRLAGRPGAGVPRAARPDAAHGPGRSRTSAGPPRPP
jgi:hypothetical protein